MLRSNILEGKDSFDDFYAGRDHLPYSFQGERMNRLQGSMWENVVHGLSIFVKRRLIVA